MAVMVILAAPGYSQKFRTTADLSNENWKLHEQLCKKKYDKALADVRAIALDDRRAGLISVLSRVRSRGVFSLSKEQAETAYSPVLGEPSPLLPYLAQAGYADLAYYIDADDYKDRIDDFAPDPFWSRAIALYEMLGPETPYAQIALEVSSGRQRQYSNECRRIVVGRNLNERMLEKLVSDYPFLKTRVSEVAAGFHKETRARSRWEDYLREQSSIARASEKETERLAEFDANSREWTSADGNHKTDAVFVGFDDGLVTLQKRDGLEIKIPIKSLHTDDRLHVSRIIRSKPKK